MTSWELVLRVARLSASRKGTDVPCVCCRRLLLSFLLICIVFLLKMLSRVPQAKPCMNWGDGSLLSREGDPSTHGDLTAADLHGNKCLAGLQDLV